MSLFDGVINITGSYFLLFCVFAITFVGFVLGRITIKGVNLGDAGVFVMALVFGYFLYENLETAMGGAEATTEALEVIERLGLILFVTSVGFIAGPKFFGNMKKNFKSYVFLGFVIILVGALSGIGCIYLGRALGETNHAEFTAMIVGLMSGSLTSTPAFSAAKATAEGFESAVTAGHAIAYIFGVVGVVLFVQLIPKLNKANMEEERAKITQIDDGSKEKKEGKKLLEFDGHGFGVFALAAVAGAFVGLAKIPDTQFSLTVTGGCLLVALIFGHFGKIGCVSIMPKLGTLKLFREFGLLLFLIGAGIPGGADFKEYFKGIYFVYGIIMTIIPMIVGYLVAKYVLKLPLLNNLGSITGGMTSTPALGTLINTAGTEDVAAAYAATYPIALIAVVLASQFMIIFFS